MIDDGWWWSCWMLEGAIKIIPLAFLKANDDHYSPISWKVVFNKSTQVWTIIKLFLLSREKWWFEEIMIRRKRRLFSASLSHIFSLLILSHFPQKINTSFACMHMLKLKNKSFSSKLAPFSSSFLGTRQQSI